MMPHVKALGLVVLEKKILIKVFISNLFLACYLDMQQTGTIIKGAI